MSESNVWQYMISNSSDVKYSDMNQKTALMAPRRGLRRYAIHAVRFALATLDAPPRRKADVASAASCALRAAFSAASLWLSSFSLFSAGLFSARCFSCSGTRAGLGIVVWRQAARVGVARSSF